MSKTAAAIRAREEARKPPKPVEKPKPKKAEKVEPETVETTPEETTPEEAE